MVTLKRLIVNADDFGMTQANTIGILLAHEEGILTSTTCMMNMPFAKFALDQAKKHPDLGVGIHLVLSAGKPLTEGRSFTNDQGEFLKPKDYEGGHPVCLDELYTEWKAQLEHYIEVAGHKPTHIDSHHHVHLIPQFVETAMTLAREYDIPMRQRDHILDTYEYVRCDDRMYGDDANYDFITDAFSKNDTVLEFMCHPALVDQRLYDMSSYCLPRMKELEVLTSQPLIDFIKDNNIELINFSHIKKV